MRDNRKPRDIFNYFQPFFDFTLDVCAKKREAMCPRYLTPQSSLSKSWAGETYWLIPPTGRTIGHWLAKATEEIENDACGVVLLPSRTDTRWWHNYVMQCAAEVYFLKHRICFYGDNNSPERSCVVVFRELEPEDEAPVFCGLEIPK